MKFLIFFFGSFIVLGFSFPVDKENDSEVMESVDKMVPVVKDDANPMLDMTDIDGKMTFDMTKLEPEIDKNDKTTMIDSKDDRMMVEKAKIEDSEEIETKDEKEIMMDDDEDYYKKEEHSDSKTDDVQVIKKSVDVKDFRNKCNKPFKKPKWCTTTTASTSTTTSTTTTTTTTTPTTTQVITNPTTTPVATTTTIATTKSII